MVSGLRFCTVLIATLMSTLVSACGSSSKPPETTQNAVPLDDKAPPSTGQASSSGSHTPSPAVSQAMKALESKQFAEAKDILTKALTKDGNDVLANYYLGVAYAGLGDNANATGAYEKAVAIDVKFAEAYVNLSALQLDAKDPQGALATAERGLKNVDNPDLYLNRALALEALDKKDEALAAYGAAVKHMPDNPSLRVSYAQMLGASGKKDEALAELRRVRDGADPTLLAGASIIARNLGAYAECVAILDRAISIKDLAALRVRRGMCREDLKDEAGAKSDYERAIAMDTKFAPAHYYLGMVFQRSNDKKKACTELATAAELGGSKGVGPEAKKALASSGCH